jgi:hypothetical protein
MTTGQDNDRELLEKAAKAAGLNAHRYCEAWKAIARYTMEDGYHGPSWNPLTDSGDALELAVKLRITDLASAVGEYVLKEKHREGDDIYAITRRAIVRAAAEIGRTAPAAS